MSLITPLPDYSFKTPTENQCPWAYILLFLPFLSVFLGGLIWPVDYDDISSNPFRPINWVFYFGWAVVTILYGLVWFELFVQHSHRWILHLLMSIPIVLSILWLLIFNGTGLFVDAAFIMYALEASLIGVTVLVAGLSDVPEWSFLLLPYVGWGFYMLEYNVQEIE